MRNEHSSSGWLLAGILLLLFACLPLGTAVQFGGDEGYEMMKAVLRGKGFILYREIWSDQPPVYTLVLDWTFRLLGASVLPARCVTAGCAILMFLSLHFLLRQRWKVSAGWFAVFFLLSSPWVLGISISAMQEVPAFGLALLSICLLYCWGKHFHPGWLWASGAVMGVALEIKFIAAMVLPAMTMELILLTRAKHGPAWLRQTVMNLVRWGLTGVLVFGAIAWLWGEGSLQASLKAHFSKPLPGQTDVGGEVPADFPMPPSLFLQHADCVVPALAGAFLLLRRRQLREGVIPAAWLLTALAVHSMHRPWWSYYYLHLAIPFAWLAGLAASEALTFVAQRLKNGKTHRTQVHAQWPALLACALTALVLARSLGRLDSTVRSLRQRPRIESSAVIARMKENAAITHWAYADDPIYVFHAGLETPPELAVVTLKRFWSGQISTAGIVETCRRRRVEQVLLGSASRGDDHWKSLLASDYLEVLDDDGLKLYLARADRKP